MFANDENAFYYNGLTPDEWDRARQRIIGRAQAAVRNPRRTTSTRPRSARAWAASARRMIRCRLRCHWSCINSLKSNALSFPAHIVRLL